MRHLRSILYALVLAPSVWVLIGVGFTDDLSSRGREFFSAESISGLLLVVFAGILVSILAFSPISPAGPALTGAGFLGVTIWAFNSPTEYAALWAPEVAKDGFDLSRPAYGLAALLSIPLLCTALSARRWARYEPPVLPIIGEIGRFRGAAKAPGIPVAVEQTTIIRTPGPVVPAADRTVALNSAPAADRTVAINSGTTAADRTVARGKPAATPPVIPAPAPVIPAPAPAADRTMALPSIERATTLTSAPSQPPALPAAPKPPAAAPRPPVVAPPAAASTPKPLVLPGAPAAATAAVPKPAAQPVRTAQNLQQAGPSVQQKAPKNLGLAKSLQQAGLAQELQLSGPAKQTPAKQTPAEPPTQPLHQVKPGTDPDATTLIPEQRKGS